MCIHKLNISTLTLSFLWYVWSLPSQPHVHVYIWLTYTICKLIIILWSSECNVSHYNTHNTCVHTCINQTSKTINFSPKIPKIPTSFLQALYIFYKYTTSIVQVFYKYYTYSTHCIYIFYTLYIHILHVFYKYSTCILQVFYSHVMYMWYV